MTGLLFVYELAGLCRWADSACDAGPAAFLWRQTVLMPTAALRPCSRPGCPELVKAGYCATHKQAQEEQRGNSAERGYTWKWRKARLQFIREEFAKGNVLCPDCKRPFFSSSDIEVHHIKRHGSGKNQDLFWDRSLWLCICPQCHAARTARGE